MKERITKWAVVIPLVVVVIWAMWATQNQPASPTQTPPRSTAPTSPAQGASASSISEVEAMNFLVAISAETMRVCRSAFAGEAEAQMRTALAYAMHGMGLKVDRTRAYAWALIAEGNGAKDGESIRRQIAEPLQVEDIQKGRAWREQLERQIADTAVTPEEKCRAELIAHGLDEDLATELVQDG